MNIPKSQKGSFCLIRAELKTGLIMNNDDSVYLNTGQNYYRIFLSLQELKQFLQDAKNTNFKLYEYMIYDDKGVFYERVRV